MFFFLVFYYYFLLFPSLSPLSSLVHFFSLIAPTHLLLLSCFFFLFLLPLFTILFALLSFQSYSFEDCLSFIYFRSSIVRSSRHTFVCSSQLSVYFLSFFVISFAIVFLSHNSHMSPKSLIYYFIISFLSIYF